jgi:hypothetical protein
MNSLFLNLCVLPAAALAGAGIGFAFGLMQAGARAKYERIQAEKGFKSGWSVAPGSMRRVAYLLMALAVVQLVFPFIFAPGAHAQWWVSGGIAAGYGWALYKQLRSRLSS